MTIVTALIAFIEWHSLGREHELVPFLAAIGLFPMSFPGIAISLWPMISSSSTQAFLLIGTLFPAAGDPDVHRVVVLGVLRQGAGGCRLSLAMLSCDRPDSLGQLAGSRTQSEPAYNYMIAPASSTSMNGVIGLICLIQRVGIAQYSRAAPSRSSLFNFDSQERRLSKFTYCLGRSLLWRSDARQRAILRRVKSFRYMAARRVAHDTARHQGGAEAEGERVEAAGAPKTRLEPSETKRLG